LLPTLLLLAVGLLLSTLLLLAVVTLMLTRVLWILIHDRSPVAPPLTGKPAGQSLPTLETLLSNYSRSHRDHDEQPQRRGSKYLSIRWLQVNTRR